MSVSFDSAEGLIVIPVELTGPSGSTIVRLALDTGATNSVINVAVLVFIGYDPAPNRRYRRLAGKAMGDQ